MISGLVPHSRSKIQFNLAILLGSFKPGCNAFVQGFTRPSFFLGEQPRYPLPIAMTNPFAPFNHYMHYAFRNVQYECRVSNAWYLTHNLLYVLTIFEDDIYQR